MQAEASRRAERRPVQEQIGHASLQQTADTYGHLLPDRHKASVGALDQFLGGAGTR